MIRRFIRDAAIGRKVRAAAVGIASREILVGYPPNAIIQLQSEQGDFEIIVRRKGEGDGRS